MTELKQIHPQVSVIPATKRHLQNGNQFRREAELRVAAYCRVSTDAERQENSYTTQKNYYTMLISSRPGWKLAGIYADEGKSGTTRRGRIAFNRLMEDCHSGKVDYIITKSISRFARNTSDTLDCVHELQRLRPPVGVFFERENIDTLNYNSEMFLTFYCSMAQEESHSISENIKWSLQKNFRAGKPQINLKRMLGYDKGQNGQWIINEKEAETVRLIYRYFLAGRSANSIAEELNLAGKQTVNGKKWRADAVLYILKNEKYAGDLIMQKTYTESFLTHKSVCNTGEYPQYYRQNHHPAIICRETWLQVQELIYQKQRSGKGSVRRVQTEYGAVEIGTEERGDVQEISRKISEQKPARGAVPSPFSIMTCTGCGQKMRRMTYRVSQNRRQKNQVSGEQRDKKAFCYAVWKCSSSGGNCRFYQTYLPEISIEQSFMKMLYRIRQDLKTNGEEAEVMQAFQSVYQALCQKESENGFLEQKIKLLELEIADLEKKYQEMTERLRVADCARHIPIGENVFLRHGTSDIRIADDLKNRWEKKISERNELTQERRIADKMRNNFQNFISSVNQLPEMDFCWLDATNPQNGGNKSDMTTQNQHLLNFQEYIFRTYILRMEASGDEIRYGTTFGVVLVNTGNSVPVRAYCDFCNRAE